MPANGRDSLLTQTGRWGGQKMGLTPSEGTCFHLPEAPALSDCGALRGSPWLRTQGWAGGAAYLLQVWGPHPAVSRLPDSCPSRRESSHMMVLGHIPEGPPNQPGPVRTATGELGAQEKGRCHSGREGRVLSPQNLSATSGLACGKAEWTRSFLRGVVSGTPGKNNRHALKTPPTS